MDLRAICVMCSQQVFFYWIYCRYKCGCSSACERCLVDLRSSTGRLFLWDTAELILNTDIHIRALFRRLPRRFFLIYANFCTSQHKKYTICI